MSDEQAVQRGGLGVGNVLIALGVAALLAIISFVAVSHRRDQALRTGAVTSAASELAAQNQK